MSWVEREVELIVRYKQRDIFEIDNFHRTNSTETTKRELGGEDDDERTSIAKTFAGGNRRSRGFLCPSLHVVSESAHVRQNGIHAHDPRQERVRLLKTQRKQVIQRMSELVFIVLEGEGR